MIEFHFETPFEFKNNEAHSSWIQEVATSYGTNIEEINYIFCDDAYLLEINKKFLNHDYLTDIITFPGDGETGLMADIFISVERVTDNATQYNVTFEDEMRRVLIHGVLHLLGFNDTTTEDKEIMREKEEAAILMFHVKP